MPKTRRTRTRKQTPHHNKKQKGGMWPFSSSNTPKSLQEAQKKIAELKNQINELEKMTFPPNSAPAAAPAAAPESVPIDETRPTEETTTTTSTTEEPPKKKGVFGLGILGLGGKKTKKRVVRK